jgi:UDP-N-acetylglucosamine 4,6-dehydratase
MINQSLKNKSILITGGTGSFGMKFLEVSLSYKPKKENNFSRDELKQSIMQEKFPVKKYKNIRYFIGDIRDKDRLSIALRGVDFVVHAAALKQVPAAEYNPIEFIKTNILGAQNIIEACLSSSVKKVIALSTDKAVNPINLYGATKLASDKLMIAANNLSGNNGASFSVVRYGNVIDSRGSLLPILKELSKKSKSLPITDMEMTRFFITIEEGVKFVINSLIAMKGGETFIPKMKSLKISEMINSLYPNYNLKIIGVRPGEKIDEILFTKNDCSRIIEFKDYYLIEPLINLGKNKNYFDYKTGKKGLRISKFFDYQSNSNVDFLSGKQLKIFLKKIINL